MFELNKTKEVEELIAITKSDSGISGPELAKAHIRLGELLAENIDLEPADTTVVALLRGGIFFAQGIYFKLGCKFEVYDPKQGEFKRPTTKNVILVDSVINTGKTIVMDSVVRNMGLTEDQMSRYELLLETRGNKTYLFEGDPYSNPDPGEYQDYDIPPEALTDTRFANMIREAEKYLGYPYVWGGSSPSTSFDCSGFVSYVINHCGNGWSYGRQTADGLLNNCCTRVSKEDAKPGDLIFFQGTYDTAGASHVGIYVGNGMMIHCGNPIQYTSINTNYWQNHFYTFGRIR